MQKIGLFYGSDGGTTEEIAQKVADKLGDCQIFDVASAKAEDMKILIILSLLPLLMVLAICKMIGIIFSQS